jgi:chemotaxis signal transduction protein
VTAVDERRLVLFEVGGGAYALPIADVLEVTEWAPFAAIPMLSATLAGVINHHGDALPIVARDVLLDEPTTGERPEHVLVLGAPGGGAGRLGVPVDRVLGLVDVPAGPPATDGLVVERRPLRGRIVAVLDAARLLERAGRVIEQVGVRA